MVFDPKTETELVGKLLGSEPVKELLNPVTHEIGQLIGELGNIVRFYGTENLKKIFTKWARNREHESSGVQGKVIEAIEFERIMPLLRAASLQSDDDMQERWAALLESAATAEPNYLPGFAQTLEQISTDEAQFLDRLWRFVLQLSAINPKYPRGLEPVSESRLVYVFDSNLFSHLGERASMLVEQTSPGQLPDSESVSRARLLIDDLLRQRILGEVQTVEQGKSQSVGDLIRRVPPSSIPSALASMPPPAPPRLRTQYALTRYGMSFIQAVLPKKATENPTAI